MPENINKIANFLNLRFLWINFFQLNEIRKANSDLVVVGKANFDFKEDFDADAEEDDVDNIEESDGDDFEQETG